jgi:hypothetical protein
MLEENELLVVKHFNKDFADWMWIAIYGAVTFYFMLLSCCWRHKAKLHWKQQKEYDSLNQTHIV